jgi:hypothetical protein
MHEKYEDFFVEVNSINEMSLTQSQIVVNQMCAILIGSLKSLHL